jgi:DNA-binding MarR family transcriptional regulator
MSDDDSERSATSAQFAAIETLVDEVVSLFHLMSALTEQLHGSDAQEHGELTAGLRGVLRGLDRRGPQTVPQMARERNCSRQHIQLLVNQLEAEDLVELTENIAHKRSRLVRLTSRGKAYLEAMYHREAAFFSTLNLTIPDESLGATTAVLDALHEALQSALLRLQRESGDGSSQHADEDATTGSALRDQDN